MKIFGRVAAGVALCRTLMLAVGASPAVADPIPPTAGVQNATKPDVSDDNATSEDVARTKAELSPVASDIREERVDGRLLTSFDVESPEGLRAIVVTNEADPNVPQPRLRAGFGRGVYLYLNRADQSAAANGGAVALSVVACSIPGVNVLGCAAVSGAMAAAATYVNTYGLCANELEINIRSANPVQIPTYKCV